MQFWNDEGLIIQVAPHGESAAIVRLLTAEHGKHAGYVHHARSSRARSGLDLGTVVKAEWQSRSEGQLGTYKLEIEEALAPHFFDAPAQLTALKSLCSILDAVLPEQERYDALYHGTKATLENMTGDFWSVFYVMWEIALLEQLGFGLDLTKCAATGEVDDLLYVSPKSGCAVSAAAGEAYKHQLFKLPSFMRGGDDVSESEIFEGLRMTGYFLENRVFNALNKPLPDARLALHEKFRPPKAEEDQAEK